MKEIALKLFDEIECRLDGAISDDDYLAIGRELHGACLMAVRLGVITCDEWEAIVARASL